MRLGPEHRPDLVDPLEDAHHLLLVELRALREVRRPAEVVDLEDVRAGLGRRGDELGRLDLGEARRVERAPEPAQSRRRELPLRLLGGVPPGDRGVVQQRRQPGVEGGSPQLDGRRRRRLRQRRDHRVGDLDAAGCLGVRGRRADHLDGGLLGRDRTLADHDLGEAGAVADDEERERRELAATVDPALQPDLGSGLGGGQFGRERALHGYLQWRKPWRCGRGLDRGATTPSPRALSPESRPLVGTPYARATLLEGRHSSRRRRNRTAARPGGPTPFSPGQVAGSPGGVR